VNDVSLSNLSRRRFIAAAGLGAATAVFAPRLLFCTGDGIVPTMINEAARAKIEVTRFVATSVFSGLGWEYCSSTVRAASS